ncbi:MAG: hypothetical protein C0485_14555 [Pirellula sp.]|nr:hypothetical protein [Pirellula sp.]
MATVGSTATLPERTRPLTIAWVRAAAPTGVIALLVVGSILLTRRAAGAFSAHLPTLPLLATIVLTAMVILGGRVAWRLTSPPRRREQLQFREQTVGWGGTLALGLMFLGCSFPSFGYWNWLCWLPLIIADYLQRDWFFETAPPAWTPRLHDHEPNLAPWRPRGDNAEPSALLPLAPAREEVREHYPLFEREFDEATADEEQGGETLPSNVLQQLTRIRNDAGVESIFGTLRAEFAAGQRHATLHVGFCPPLADAPTVEADPADGPDATVKVIQAFAHGARLEVRLTTTAAEPCSVLLEITAAPADHS